MINNIVAAISSFFANFVSGALPFVQTHAILLGCAISGDILVAVGIIIESWPPKNRKELAALIFVFGGVIMSALFTVALFVFDEGISGVQKSKIATLDARLAARVLSNAQISELRKTLEPFGSHTFTMNTYWDANEPLSITRQIGNDVLLADGWQFVRPTGYLIGVIVGIQVYKPKDDPGGEAAAKALVAGLDDAGIDASLRPNAGIAHIDIEVGIKP